MKRKRSGRVTQITEVEEDWEGERIRTLKGAIEAGSRGLYWLLYSEKKRRGTIITKGRSQKDNIC